MSKKTLTIIAAFFLIRQHFQNNLLKNIC